MKHIVMALSVVGFGLFLASSLFFTLRAKPIYTGSNAQPADRASKVSSGEQKLASNAKRVSDAENSVENAGDIALSCTSNPVEAKSNQSNTSSGGSQSEPDPKKNPDASPETSPPDGAIFYGGDAPYAYIPTYTPKEPTKIPIMPPEAGN